MFIGRLKDFVGADAEALTSIASASTVTLPDNDSVFLISGSTTINLLIVNPNTYGRLVILIGDTSSTAALANNNDPTTVGQMDLGGSNANVAQQDVVVLYCKTDGTWVLVSKADN